MSADKQSSQIIFLDSPKLSKERQALLDEQCKRHDDALIQELSSEIRAIIETSMEEILALAEKTRAKLRYNVPPLTEHETNLFAYKTAQRALLLELDSVEGKLEKLELARKSS